jgi:hypothetical protein
VHEAFVRRQWKGMRGRNGAAGLLRPPPAQPAKTTFFAGGRVPMSAEIAREPGEPGEAGLRQRSWQKSRLLPAITTPMSAEIAAGDFSQ